jgi:hypothetical protein
MSDREIGLHDGEMPELFQAADASSLAAQRRYIRSTGAQLLLLVAAAAAGAVNFAARGSVPGKVFQVIALAALLAAATLRTHLIATKPDAAWFEGRAAAESVKTLAWRYAVGGDPYRIDAPDGTPADRAFSHQLLEIIEPLTAVPLPPIESVDQVTPAMKRLRGAPMEFRRDAYLRDRIDSQRRWYATRANDNSRKAQLWSFAVLGFELAGITGSVVKLTTHLPYDVVGLAAAVAGVAGAWLQTKQHDTLSSSYAIAARELADIAILAAEPSNEGQWADFVERAETAISREHTLWRASRGARGGLRSP